MVLFILCRENEYVMIFSPMMLTRDEQRPMCCRKNTNGQRCAVNDLRTVISEK